MQFDFEYTEHATMPIVILDGAVVILVTLFYSASYTNTGLAV